MFRTVVPAVFVGLALPGSAVADPLRAQQWNLDMVESDAAHGTSTGEPPGSEVPGALTSICDVKAPSAGTWREIRDMRG